jgi:hypothetical protein
MLFTAGFTSSSSAQTHIDDSADSLQRVLMKDSLQVTDAVITQIYIVRDSFLSRASQIDADTLLSSNEKSNAKQILIAQTNTDIKTLLGETLYNQYTQMIRRRAMNRTRNINIQPLASQLNN